MVLTLAETQSMNICGTSQQQMSLRITELRAVPGTVKAGEEINQIVVYTLCISSDTVALRGRMTRAVMFQGKELFRDASNTIDFKPGVWAVGALVGIPKGAKNGTYTFDVTLSSKDHSLKQSQMFQVDTPTRKQ